MRYNGRMLQEIEARSVVVGHLKQTTLRSTLLQTLTKLPLVISYDTLEVVLGLSPLPTVAEKGRRGCQLQNGIPVIT